MTDVNPLFPLFPPYAELPTLEWWKRLEQHFQEMPSWGTIETILLREQLDGRLGFAFGKYLDLCHRGIIAEFDISSVSLTTLRPKGRRFLQQDANVLAQQCF